MFRPAARIAFVYFYYTFCFHLAETHTTQYAFIKRSRISWSVFYYWLTGKSLPSMDNLVRIAKTLDRSVDYLLGRV